ncbi:MAG: hypothetical protein ACOYOA_15565, partial [Saprospiraceae bacterium]
MKNVIAIALLFFAFEKIHAQLKENTPCTAICVDYTKSSISGRQPNQDAISPNLNLPCGSGSSEDNPFWWMLRPSGKQLDFQFTTSNCVAGNSYLGVQLTLWEGDNCGSLTAVDCVKGESGTLSTAVNPYKLYYLQIDGNGECQCNFIISYDKNQLLSAIPPPTISGPHQICKASNIRYSASVAALPGLAPDSWNWTLEPANAGVLTKVPGSPADINLNFTTAPPNGKLKICAQPVYKSKCSPSTQKSCYELEVIDLQPATCKVEICPQSLPFNLSLAACVLTTNPNFGRRMT